MGGAKVGDSPTSLNPDRPLYMTTLIKESASRECMSVNVVFRVFRLHNMFARRAHNGASAFALGARGGTVS